MPHLLVWGMDLSPGSISASGRTMNVNNILPIFRFLQDKVQAKQKTVLITLVAVTGASTRNPGTHMAGRRGA